ncbi:hypothetical protein K435DRAFT_966574 [Dendrothele bispora CBS 962.96]|uniref:Uncharacterized protein n=1 Tax=Dendrothele bispora (strain CBS 962.96) TaxID=1314807 RepID=A0A4S8LZI4_DENBC|nr:hypothetical protein K435DRAFT_966574 [Dendrothele bispora CBS 962.96]
MSPIILAGKRISGPSDRSVPEIPGRPLVNNWCHRNLPANPVLSNQHVPPQRYPRYTLSLRLRSNTICNTMPLTIKVNKSRAVTFTVDALISEYCRPGCQLILGSDVQAACTKATETGLPDTLQRLSCELIHTQPVALSPSYSFGPSPTQPSAHSATVIL